VFRKLSAYAAIAIGRMGLGTSRTIGRVSSSILKSGQQYWWGGSMTGVYGDTPAAGMGFNQESAMTLPTVYACTRARAETLASLPPMIFLEVANSLARRRSSDNRLWELLHDSPNEDMDSMVFYELMQTRVVNRGNGFAEIERDRNDRPVALWPLHNSRVLPHRDNNGQLEWTVTTDIMDPRTELYKAFKVADRDMLNIVGFGSDGYLSTGVVPMAVEEISLNMAMTQYAGQWFAKGARPSAVVEYPTYIDDDDERAEMRRQVNALHSGREHWHEIPVLWEGAKWKEIQYSPEQSQLIESKKYGAKTLCSFYNVPPALVQIFDEYKFSTVDAMIQQFVMTCVRADAVRFERAIRRKVTHTRDSQGRLRAVFENPYVFEFVLEALLRGDAKKQAETLEIERRNGITSADEWRGLNNREPLPKKQGEVYLVPGGFENLATLGSTYPGGKAAAASGSDSRGKSGSKDDDSEDQENKAGFNKARLVQALESGIPQHHDRSRGGSVGDASTVRDELDVVAVDVLAEAIERVEVVIGKELARIHNSSKGEERGVRHDEAWRKHAARLEAAILPACKIYCRYRDGDPEKLASCMAGQICSDREVGGQVNVELFESAMQ
jgi:HK97 family phage portal protein